MTPHETEVENGDAGPPNVAPSSGPSSGLAGESNVKRRVRHARQASVDQYHEARNDFQHAVFLPHDMPAQRKRKSVTISQKHLPTEMKSDARDAQLSSPSAPSPEATASSFTPSQEPQPEEKNGQPPSSHPHRLNDTAGVAHPKERPRKPGPRRGSPRRRLSPNSRLSPHQRPHAMDFMVGEPDEQQYYAPAPPGAYQGGPGNIAGRFGSRSPDEPFDGHYPPPPPPPSGPNHLPFNRFGSPEMPFHPEGGAFFSQPPGPPPFPADLPLPPALPALPPPERQPSGYELLAAKLSGNIAGPRLAPIYRRFETLHHRLLLHLQDELTQLESQLDELDTQDAHHRMYGHGLPGPRRTERNGLQDICWRRNDILSQIAQKLYQYNQALASFKETQDLGEPTVAEAFGYRNYLENVVPEVIEVYNFLEAPDLVSLARRKSVSTEPADDPLTQLPRSVGLVGFPPASSPPSETGSNRSSARRSHVRTTPAPRASSSLAVPVQVQAQAQTPLSHAVMALGAAILTPILSFSVLHDFISRMTIVLLIGVSSAVTIMQSGQLRGLMGERTSMDFVVCVGVYGAVMTIIAGIVA